MNLRRTLILAVILAGATLYLKQVSLPGRDRQLTERMAFSRLTSDSIDSVEVVTANTELTSYILDRKAASDSLKKANGGTWTLRGVDGAVLDTTGIDSFVSALSALEVEGPLDERETGYDVSVFGLDRPSLTLTVNEKGERRTEVAFGKKNEYLSKRYAKISGKKGIFLADEGIFASVNKSSFDVRSKTPVEFADSDIRVVTISSKAGSVKLEQSVVGLWKIVEPSPLPASAESIGAALKVLKGLQVVEFLDHASGRLSEFGLDSPAVTLSLSFREGIEPREVSFRFSEKQRPDSTVASFAKSSTTDTVFKLASSLISRLAISTNDLRERKIVPYADSEIKKLSAAIEDGQKVDISVSGVSWAINGKQSDPVFTQQYLKDVASFSASEFPTRVPTDAFAKPMVVLDIIKDAESNQRVTVTVGAETTGSNKEVMRFVKTSASDTVYLVRDIEAKRVVPREEALVERATPTSK
jgi:hypothetical protein